jgi:hypothetical protein
MFTKHRVVASLSKGTMLPPASIASLTEKRPRLGILQRQDPLRPRRVLKLGNISLPPAQERAIRLPRGLQDPIARKKKRGWIFQPKLLETGSARGTHWAHLNSQINSGGVALVLCGALPMIRSRKHSPVFRSSVQAVRAHASVLSL